LVDFLKTKLLDMKPLNISEVIGLIDDNKLEELGKFYKVDKANHKITGAFILKSFVRSALLGRPISLRSIEEMVSNLADLSSLLKSKSQHQAKVDHSSIGKRLEKLEVNYYRAIYEDLVLKFNALFNKSEQEKLYRFDSTIINLSGRMIKDGLKIGGKMDDSQIKVSVGLKNTIPSSIRFCNTQSEANEDIALLAAIKDAKLEDEDILLFDRGITKTATYEEFTNREIKFVTRVKANRRYVCVEQKSIATVNDDKVNNAQVNNTDADNIEAETKIKICSDEIIRLYHKNNLTDSHLRLIKATTKDNNDIWFLTNLLGCSAEEITQMYKSRWDIEVFFKFIKQNLQFKHFISHNKNGMSVYIYCILIAAILFAVFKKSNQLQGFKIPLLRFTLLLEKEIIKDLIILSGGNPKLVEDRL
jgi:hypothetical protein